MNSYNAPDAVNQVDWDLVSVNKDTIDYVRQLIHLKKTLPALSLNLMRRFTNMSLCIQPIWAVVLLSLN